MRKLIVAEYMSLDGVVQAPGHAAEDTDGAFTNGGWTAPFMADHRRYISLMFQTVGAFLFGRRTYEIFAEYWPTVTEESDLIAHALNGLPKYVASTTLTDVAWQPTTIIKADLAGTVVELKQQPGNSLVVIGSSQLTHALIRHGLVDEYQLWLHPVLLGSGKRLTGEDTPMTSLRLIDSMTTGSGLVILTYQP